MLAPPKDPKYRSGSPTTCRPAGCQWTDPPGWTAGAKRVVVVVVDEVDVEGGGRLLAEALPIVAAIMSVAKAIDVTMSLA